MTVARNKNRPTSHAPATNQHERGVTTSRRFHGLDAARAVAIIGMLAVNVGPRKEPGDTDVAILLYDVPHGRASLLFMILAGMGMSLMPSPARETDAPLPWRTLFWPASVVVA